jgi:multidrug efflux pump subunit AcrB
MEVLSTHQPFSTEKLAMKWDGEWHITYEVFRDLGAGFAVVLVLIYVLVVGASVILFDPIFQGLAISLMAGEVGSRFLSRMAVPVIYFITARSRAGLSPRSACIPVG